MRDVFPGAGGKKRTVSCLPAWRATLGSIGLDIESAPLTCSSEEACVVAVRVIARVIRIMVTAPGVFRHVVNPCPHLLLGG